MLGRNGFPKAGDGGLKLEVTAQALVRHAPVEDQHGDMTFFASQHEAGPEFGFQQANYTRADLIERLLHEFWRVQREKRRTDGQPRVLLMKFSRHILQNVEPLPCPRGGEHIQRFRSAPLFAQYGKIGEEFPDEIGFAAGCRLKPDVHFCTGACAFVARFHAQRRAGPSVRNQTLREAFLKALMAAQDWTGRQPCQTVCAAQQGAEHAAFHCEVSLV